MSYEHFIRYDVTVSNRAYPLLHASTRPGNAYSSYINPLIIPSSFKALDKTLVSKPTCISVHRQLSSSELDNCRQMDAYELVYVG